MLAGKTDGAPPGIPEQGLSGRDGRQGADAQTEKHASREVDRKLRLKRNWHDARAPATALVDVDDRISTVFRNIRIKQSCVSVNDI